VGGGVVVVAATRVAMDCCRCVCMCVRLVDLDPFTLCWHVLQAFSVDGVLSAPTFLVGNTQGGLDDNYAAWSIEIKSAAAQGVRARTNALTRALECV
jgi:hypothetical protein